MEGLLHEMALPPLLPRTAGPRGAKPTATHIIKINENAVFSSLKKRSPLQQIEFYETSTNGQKKKVTTVLLPSW